MTDLPTPYQEFIHKSRYARWLEDENRRETWPETVDRYVDYMCDTQCAGKIPKKVRKQIRQAILNLEVMPSMRCMMTAGRALERDNVAAFNCFTGDTLVTTKEYGIIAIGKIAGQEVHIVDGNGEWVKARCRSYGKSDSLLRVSLAVSGRGEDFCLTATNNHDWIMRDGTRKKTYELKRDDRLAFVSMPARDEIDEDSSDYKAGVVHGIIYGDGSAQYRKKEVCSGFAIRICSDAEDLLPYFNDYPLSYPPSFKGDPVVYLFGKEAIDLKALPETDIGFFTDSYLVGFMRGWMAADGSVSKGGQTSLSVNEEGLSWMYKNGPRLGFVIKNHRRYPNKTNLGKRSQHLYYAEFDRRWMDKDDILIGRKRDRFSKIEVDKNPGFGRVTDVIECTKEQDVFCFDVYTTHSFLLTRNILTGNCSYVAIDDPKAFDETLYLLMCGSGVGMSVERQFINNLPVIAERLRPSQTVICVEDSKLGWANAYRELVSMLYQGRIPKWDVSAIRPKGARLKTFGGRASGPKPLEDLFRFTIETFKTAEGRKLTSIECHDLLCKIAEIVVVGGVRRCLPEGTLVHLRRGLVPIEKVEPGDEAVSLRGEYKEVMASVFTGERETVVIETQIGEFECSPEHRMAVLDSLDGDVKWVEAGLLDEDDFLVFPKSTIPGTETALPEWEYISPPNSTTCKDISVPEFDADMAWWIGNLHGDGYVFETNRETADANGYVSIACACDVPEQHTRSVEGFARFGLVADEVERDSDRCTKPRVSSHQLATYLAENFKRPKTPLAVPECVLQGTVEVRAAYIAGLFDSDGGKWNRPVLVVTSVYESFLGQVQIVLASLGIPSTLKMNRDETAGGWQPLYYLSLKGMDHLLRFEQIVGPHSSKIRDGGLPERCKEQNSYIVPKRLLRLHENRSKFSSTYRSLRGKVNLSWWKYEKEAGEQWFVPIRVKDVRETEGTKRCWDLQIEDTECFVANGLLTHNSAVISLSNPSDDRMRHAKSGNWSEVTPWRALANNSACFTEKPGMDVFMREWLALYDSKSGERGIFNREAVTKWAEKIGRRDTDHEFGSNPCVPDDTWIMTDKGPMQVKSLIGKPFIAVVQGVSCPSRTGFVKTGHKQVFRLEADKGYDITLTDNHKLLKGTRFSSQGVVLDSEWTDLKDISVGDKILISNQREFSDWAGKGSFEEGWLVGELVGDGGFSYRPDKSTSGYVRFWGDSKEYMSSIALERTKSVTEHRSGLDIQKNETYEQVICVGLSGLALSYGVNFAKLLGEDLEATSCDFHRGFLRGFFDADGSVQGNLKKGASVRLGQADLERLKTVQRMLSRLGIVSSIYQGRKPEGWYKLPDGNGGMREYFCNEMHELVISRDNIAIFRERVGFEEPEKQARLDELLASYSRSPNTERFEVSVRAIVPLGEKDVFDCTVDEVHEFDANGIRTHNCSEIVLRSKELCNLSEVVVRPDDDLESLKKKVRLATIIGTMQATLTNFRYLRDDWRANCEEEALLGVSLTGIMDHELMAGRQGKKELADTLDQLREYAIEVNAEWAEKLGINPSAAITCNKPSGTVSQLVNCASGIHPRFSHYYIRRVKASKADPVAVLMAHLGIPFESCASNPKDVVIFKFPVQVPDGAVVSDDISALDHLSLWKTYQLHWCEHKPSITVFLREHEWMEVGAWVYRNFDIVSGIAFLPKTQHSYQQPPYEECTKQDYEELLAQMPSEYDWTRLSEFEKEDRTVGTQVFACTGDKCELVDLITHQTSNEGASQ